MARDKPDGCGVTMVVDAIAAAERWLAPVRLDTTSVLFVIGLGEGHVLEALNRRRWAGHVIALEPGAASIAECLNRKTAREWQLAGRLTVLAGPDYIGLDKVLSALPVDTEKPVIAGNPEVARAHREACVHAARTVARAWFGARANDEARKKNAGRYLSNTLRNAGTIVREGDAAVLGNLFAGTPALVVAAGPSLDRNIADIVRYRDRVVVVAADTALRPLLSAGVEPDFVVATDPTETNARHLNDLPSCPRTHLVAEGSVDSEALPHFDGRTFFFRIAEHHPWPWLREQRHDRVRLRAWGSVLTTAFDLALTMGCEPIVFAGADLAFSDDRPYARGTTYEEVWRRAEMWGQPIEDCWSAAIAGWPDTREIGVTGDIVRTAPHLRSFRDWIATEARKATGRTIINGTGGGILLGEGITQQPLHKALSALPVLAQDITARIVGARRLAGTLAGTIGEPDEATLAAWQAFAGPPAVPAAPAPATTEVAEPEVVFDCLPGVDLNAAIEAAWQNMSADHQRLILRDQTGTPAGAAVRRALFSFIERHPEVSARFGRFFDPNDDRSWIDRRPSSELFPGEDRDKWQDHHADVANRLTPLIVERLSPSSVLDMGCGAGHWLRALTANGVDDVTGIEKELGAFTPARSYDLCLCLCVVQSLTMKAAEAVIQACTQASDTVLFAVPAPAIGVPGFITERPASVWAELFARHGFAAHDELRPEIENRWGRYRSSYDLVTVYRRVVAKNDAIPEAMRTALVASASRVDDLVIQFLLNAQAAEVAAQESQRPAHPLVTMTKLVIPAGRMEAADADGARCFRFRTAAGARALSAAIEPPAVVEDGKPVASVVHQDTVTFQSSDGSDPRRNGRGYAIAVPAHVDWLERLPLSTILEHQL